LINIQYNNLLANDTATSTSVCVRSPIFFLINTNVSNDVLNSNSSDVVCYLAECWDGTNDTTVMVKNPSFVPIPVEANPDCFPILNLLRARRDFGIMAAIISANVVSVASATTATITMTKQVQTAETVNQIVERTAVVLEILEEFNTHLASDLLLANHGRFNSRTN